MKKIKCFRGLAELKKRLFERIKERLERAKLVREMAPETQPLVAALVQVNGVGEDILYGSRVVVMSSGNNITLISVDENGGVVQVRRYDNAILVENAEPVTMH